VNEGFNDAAAYTTIVPDGAPEDVDGDFEPHATAPVSNPATSIVDTKPAGNPVRGMGKT
jgi:hypothetical protein